MKVLLLAALLLSAGYSPIMPVASATASFVPASSGSPSAPASSAPVSPAQVAGQPDGAVQSDQADQPGEDLGRTVIALRPYSEVTGDRILLGDVAVVTSYDEKLAGDLRKIVLGAAPLPGYSRSIHVFNIETRLRQAGFHPSNVELQYEAGEDEIQVSRPVAVPGNSSPAPAGAGALLLEGPADSRPAAGISIRRGDYVSIQARAGWVTVTARGIAKKDGAIGEVIPVENIQSGKVVYGAVQDSVTVIILP